MKKAIITIGRQYGSGGRAVGRMLADRLGIPFYDKELIELAAKEGGMSPEVFERVDEKPTSSLLYSLAVGSASIGSMQYMQQAELPLNDRLFILSSGVIRDLARQGSCVIIGRCANYILREDPALCSVFVHASLSKRIERITRLYEVPADKAESTIARMDKQRSNYYGYYTGKTWMQMDNYHLCLDSGLLGVEKTVDVIQAYVAARREEA